jgi:hypothetical protein
MKKRIVALSAAMLIILGTGTAFADTLLYTPMVSAPLGGSLSCNVTKVGKKPLAEVVVTMVRSSTSSQNACIDLEPVANSATGHTCSLTGGASSLCMVTIVGGNQRSVRAVLNVRDSNGGTILSVPATK